MTYECILYEKANGVAVIRLNRPKVLNAMNKRMWTDLEAALDDALDDPAIKAVVITGEGRAFSTGADLKESKTRSLAEYRDYLERLQEVSRKIIRFEKPTIAAINGYALGSGYELALRTYQTVVDRAPDSWEAEKAQFRIAHVYLRMGLATEAAETWRTFVQRYPSSEWMPFADRSLGSAV